MEYDRYQANSKIFVLGIACLILSISLLLFSLYNLPFLLFGWVYRVPEFILHWIDWFEQDLLFSHTASTWIVLLIFLIPAILFGLLAYYCSNKIDNEIFGITTKSEEGEIFSPAVKRDLGETAKFGSKILLLIVGVLILLTLFEWLIV